MNKNCNLQKVRGAKDKNPWEDGEQKDHKRRDHR